MKLCFLAKAVFLFAVPATAEPVWSAGRLELEDGASFCSAVLIKEDVIATAAHCASEDEATSVVFRPGNGRVGRSFKVKRFLNHPLYESFKTRVDWRLRFDFAIAELAEPVPNDIASPIAMGDDAKIGERLFLISWRTGDRPRQRICQVIDGIGGLVTMGCAVSGGESGAPVMRMTDSGLELVAIISSRGRQLNQPVAHASNVRLRLTPLLDQLNGP